MPYHASASRATLIGYLFAPLLNTKYYSLKLNVLHDMTPDYLRQLILVENHEYRIKNCKVDVSRQANHSQFTDFNFVFSPFTKLKALNPVSRKNPFHTLDKGRTIRERKNPSMCVHVKPYTEAFQCTHFNSCHPAGVGLSKEKLSSFFGQTLQNFVRGER